MDLMKSMADVRTTSYFRSYAIAEIRIAYRIKEYLDPDDIFPPRDLNRATSILLQNGEYREAVERIMDKELSIDIDSSSGYESLVEEAINFAKSFLEKDKSFIVNNESVREEMDDYE